MENEIVIPEFQQILITEKEFIFTPFFIGGKTTKLNRNEWALFVDDVKQFQDERVMARRRSRILFDNSIGCRIDHDKKRIFCGKDPEKVGFYVEYG